MRPGQYEIRALLGAGGMGEVYRAFDPNLKRDVAIKILPETFAEDPERVARFRREAQLLAALNHPNIAVIHDVQQAGGTLYLVLELIEFKDMRRHAARARLQDPNSTRIQLRVADIDAAAAAVVQAGGTFVSTGGKPVELPAGNSTLRASIARDPDDLFLVLIQAPAPAP